MPPKVPSFAKIFNSLTKKGVHPSVASAQAHSAIREYQRQYEDASDSEEEDEDDSRRIISSELVKMRTHLAKLLNKYKQDPTLPVVIRYLSRTLKKI